MENITDLSIFINCYFLMTSMTEVKASGTTGIHQVIETSLPIYLDASEESEIVGLLGIGDFVMVENQHSDWGSIQSHQLLGYVRSEGIVKVQPTIYLVDKNDGTRLGHN